MPESQQVPHEMAEYIRTLESLKNQTPPVRPTADFVQKANTILNKHNFGINITKEDFWILNTTPCPVLVDECTEGRFSTHLTSSITPRLSDIELYHYTQLNSAQNILSSCTLRARSIKNRIGEDELATFLAKFGISYPLKNDKYKTSIADGLCYISFAQTTISKEEDDDLWWSFAKSGGARLKFRLSSRIGILRKISYGNSSQNLVNIYKEISALAKANLGAEFYLSDSGVFCSYFLPDEYEPENEIRLTISKGWGLLLQNNVKPGVDDENAYYELKFGENPSIHTSIELIEVQSDSNLPKVPNVTYVKRTQ